MLSGKFSIHPQMYIYVIMIIIHVVVIFVNSLNMFSVF